MTNEDVDPKALYFFLDTITNSEDGFKYFVSRSCCDELMKIKGMFASTIPTNNQEAGN